MFEYLEAKKEYRPVTFWSLNAKLDKREADNQLKKFAAAGFGGVFLHSRVGLITIYMSEEWLEFIRFCVEKGDEYGLDMYLYDEDMWPSGYGGGLVGKASEKYCEKTLVCIPSEELTGQDKPIKEYGGKVIAVRTTSIGYTRFNGGCFPDEMNPEAMRYFLSLAHDKYFAKMPKWFGTKIKGIFTDEPCYHLHSFHPETHAPYSPWLEKRLQGYGVDLTENAEKLFFETEGYEQFRLVYYRAAAEQFEEAYTKQYAAWCKEHGIAFTGHYMEEEDCRGQIHFTGGVMRHYKNMDIPGVDKLFRPMPQLITLKQLTSVAESSGKRALCECFAGMGQEADFAARKRVLDWQAINGISFVNTHLSHYSMQGERKRDYPANINWQQPYFTGQEAESAYMARLSAIASVGKRKVNVAVLQPLSSAYVSYDPSNAEAPLLEDKIYVAVANILQGNRVDFHILSPEMLEEGIAEDGTLHNGIYTYEYLILPGVRYLTAKELCAIERFQGETLAIACEVCGRKGRRFSDLDSFAAFAKTGLMPAVVIDGGDEDVICCVRETEDGDFILIANKGQTSREIAFTVGENAAYVDVYGGAEYACPSVVRVSLFPSGLICVKTKSKTKTLPRATTFCDGYRIAETQRKELSIQALPIPLPNILNVDKVDFEAEGKRTGVVPVNHIWHYIFYKLEDGTPFEATYTFFSDIQPTGEIFALIENAENLESIVLNGVSVTPERPFNATQVCDEGCYIDISLCRVDVSGKVQKGENKLVIKGKKYNNVNDVCCHHWVKESASYSSTEVDTIYICGSFGVEIRQDVPVIVEEKTVARGDVVEQGYPFYAGKTCYTIKEQIDEGDEIELDGDFACAIVEYNDKREILSGLARTFVVKEPCEKLRITLYNTLYNMFGPHHIIDYENRLWIDAGIFNDKVNVTSKYRFEKFGLKGVYKIFKR